MKRKGVSNVTVFTNKMLYRKSIANLDLVENFCKVLDLDALDKMRFKQKYSDLKLHFNAIKRLQSWAKYQDEQ